MICSYRFTLVSDGHTSKVNTFVSTRKDEEDIIHAISVERSSGYSYNFQ